MWYHYFSKENWLLKMGYYYGMHAKWAQWFRTSTHTKSPCEPSACILYLMETFVAFQIAVNICFLQTNDLKLKPPVVSITSNDFRLEVSRKLEIANISIAILYSCYDFFRIHLHAIRIDGNILLCKMDYMNFSICSINMLDKLLYTCDYCIYRIGEMKRMVNNKLSTNFRFRLFMRLMVIMIMSRISLNFFSSSFPFIVHFLVLLPHLPQTPFSAIDFLVLFNY